MQCLQAGTRQQESAKFFANVLVHEFYCETPKPSHGPTSKFLLEQSACEKSSNLGQCHYRIPNRKATKITVKLISVGITITPESSIFRPTKAKITDIAYLSLLNLRSIAASAK